MPTYARAPVEFVRGEGARLWDADGSEYLDFFAGLSVHNAGHCHPRIVAAIREQAATLAAAARTSIYSRARDAAVRAARRAPASAARPSSATRARRPTECALKLVRKHAHARGIESPEVVVLEHGFHGRTLGALAATAEARRARTCSGRCRPGSWPVPARRPARARAAVAARRRRRSCSSRSRARPGSSRSRDEVLLGRARGLRRGRGAARLRRGADGHGPDRVALGLSSSSRSAPTS